MGQEDTLGPGCPLRAAIVEDRVPSLILHGPPGSGKTTLAHATVYVAAAPKSNACYVALGRAEADVRELRSPAVPVRLRDTSYQGAARLGHGEGYLYPHDHPGHRVAQQYLPAGLRTPYYQPTDQGWERRLRRRVASHRVHSRLPWV